MTKLEELERERKIAQGVLNYMLQKRSEILKATNKAEVELASIDHIGKQ